MYAVRTGGLNIYSDSQAMTNSVAGTTYFSNHVAPPVQHVSVIM